MAAKRQNKPQPRYFKTALEFRKWLDAEHAKKQELWVGFHKKSSGKPSLSYSEALDEALCYGWIDGIRKSVNESSYTSRFTPRKADSIWSQVNINRVRELLKLERMMPAGIAAFERRDASKSLLYSYERATPQLESSFEKQFQAQQKAWQFFQAQAPWYRRTATFWVMSAKREETRRKRLATLIRDSADGHRLAVLTSKSKQKATE